ncbi:unnamed protein product [Rotaria magnacalcarata]|uniref:Nuclear receptor domain-containing protein n=1 Tax=Rotaria magnacalcarata TaxID=392030 RepID=A0A816LX60_9BILA|nr:unnamed protein product [Rotaria magnacalcarata]CAF3850629.1 unnamed protein product [Rotaria magnacalcarata]
MKHRKTVNATGITSHKECRICGDVARGLNFNVMTCMSCKSFFRRNAQKKTLLSLCQFESNCGITIRTRGYCSPCRLKKCLELGMNPELIRHVSDSSKILKKNKHTEATEPKRTQLPTPLPLSLLQNDRSTLTTNEWTLLSNILHAFDEENALTRIQCSLDALSALPPKLRSKPIELMKLISQLYGNVGSLLEHSPDFHSLPFDARQLLLKHNLYIIGVMNGLYVGRELNVFDNTAVFNLTVRVYGPEYMIEMRRNIARYDHNGSLIKILLFIIGFSSNCSIVIYNDEEPYSIVSSSINLVRIQNIYVTMLWKYLVYLYGFHAAVLKFSRLVKNAVDLMSTLNATPHGENRNRVLDTIVKETQLKLVISE